MSNDKKVIDKMLKILADAKQEMQEIEKGIQNPGLSLDVDRAYDGIYQAEEQLLSCMKVA